MAKDHVLKGSVIDFNRFSCSFKKGDTKNDSNQSQDNPHLHVVPGGLWLIDLVLTFILF
jgi:hypothetical protein